MEWLRLPETRAIRDLDDPSTTLLHAEIVQRKPFLKRLYVDFYRQFRNAVPHNIEGKLLVELGSGGGFIKNGIPNCVTSDLYDFPTVDKRFSALEMPFESETVDAFFMLDVLHHMGDCRAFFKEADRCLKVGGKIVMIEPASTLWSRFIYKNFHHERFDPTGGWGFDEAGRLSSANLAIPWIIFYRDRKQFAEEFPSLKIVKLKPHTPFRYLVSGGVSMRQIVPSFTYSLFKGLETVLSPLNRYLGMFVTIEMERIV